MIFPRISRLTRKFREFFFNGKSSEGLRANHAKVALANSVVPRFERIKTQRAGECDGIVNLTLVVKLGPINIPILDGPAQHFQSLFEYLLRRLCLRVLRDPYTNQLQQA